MYSWHMFWCGAFFGMGAICAATGEFEGAIISAAFTAANVLGLKYTREAA